MDSKGVKDIPAMKQEVICAEREEESLAIAAYGEVNDISHSIKFENVERKGDTHNTEAESFGHPSKGTNEVCFNHVAMMKSEHLCRICVKESNFYKHIIWQCVLDKQLFDIINELCHVDICYGDGLPEYICLDCYNKVLEFHKFKETCHKGKNILLSMRPTYLKVMVKEGGSDVNLIEQLPVKKCLSQADVVSQSEWESSNGASVESKTFCQNLREGKGLSQGSELDSRSNGSDSECDCKDQMDIDDFGLSHLKTEPPDEIEENVSSKVQPINQPDTSTPLEECVLPLNHNDKKSVVNGAQSCEEVLQDSSAQSLVKSCSTSRKPRQRKQALTERNSKGGDCQFPEDISSIRGKNSIIKSSSGYDSVISSGEPTKEKVKANHKNNEKNR